MDCHKGFVLVSGYFVYGLSLGFFNSLGVLFTVIMDTFNASRAETSVIQSIYAVFVLGGGIVYGAIVSRFGPLNGTVCGSLATSFGLIVSFWATSLPYLIATSIVTAFGCGLCFVTCTVGIRRHFHGKSGVMAMSLVSSSAGTIGVGLTYLLRYLSIIYGLRGTLLIMGGIQLNSSVLCLLWRLPAASTKLQREIGPDNKGQSNTAGGANDRPELQFKNNDCYLKTSNQFHQMSKEDIRIEPNSDCSINKGDISSNYTTDDIPGGTKFFNVKFESTNSNIHKEQTARQKPVTNIPFQGKTHSETVTECNDEKTVIYKLKHILRLPSYSFTLIAMVMCTNSAQMYVAFIVDMFADRGLSVAEGSVALVIINIAAILGRASPALLVQCPFYNPFLLPVTAGVLSTVSMSLFLGPANVYMLFCLAGVIGFSFGVYISVVVVNMLELVGQDFLAVAVGLILSAIGVFASIAGILTGFLRDSSGSYSNTHTITATVTGLGTLMLLVAYYFYSQQKKASTLKQSSVIVRSADSSSSEHLT